MPKYIIKKDLPEPEKQSTVVEEGGEGRRRFEFGWKRRFDVKVNVFFR